MDRGLSCVGRLGVVLVLMPLVGWTVLGAGFIEWDAELIAALSGPAFGIDGSSATFRGGYAWGDVGSVSGSGMSYGATGTFGENGSRMEGAIHLPLPTTTEGTVELTVYHKTDLVIDWAVGTWGVLASAALSMETAELSRFSTTANVTAYGTSATAAFSLADNGGAYTTGLTLELAGTTFSGMGVTLVASFGAPPGPPPTESCGFDFRGFSVGFEGFPWCCIHTDIDLTFGRGGFELVDIDVDIDIGDGLLTLDGSLVFEIDEKRLSLIPRIHLRQDCIWFNVGIEPQAIGTGAPNVIDSLVVRGFGMSACEVGTSDFSMIASLVGGLHKLKRSCDLTLHANGYYIALDPSVSPAQYVQTDYAMVWTLEHGLLNSDWTIDVYFSVNGATLFDLALLTAEWTQQFAAGLDTRLAFQLDPAGVESKLLFGFAASAPLP